MKLSFFDAQQLQQVQPLCQAYVENPTAEELRNFMTGAAWNGTGGFWAGLNYTASATSDRSSLGAGYVTPQIGGSWTYSWMLGSLSNCQ